MNTLSGWIRRHQVIAFIAITFAISWGLAFSWDAVLNRDQGLFLPLAFVSTCGPGDHRLYSHQYPTKTGIAQSILDCPSRSVGCFCARLYCQLKVHGRTLTVTRISRHILNFSSTSCFYPCIGLFPNPVREELPGFADPAAWCVGVGSPGSGIAPCFALDLRSR